MNDDVRMFADLTCIEYPRSDYRPLKRHQFEVELDARARALNHLGRKRERRLLPRQSFM